MSCGVRSRSTRRQHALSNSTLVAPSTMPGLLDPVSATSIFSRLRSSRTTRISSLSDNARQGSASLASITRLTTGKSSDVSTNRDPSQMKMFRPSSTLAFRPWAIYNHASASVVSHLARSGGGVIRLPRVSARESPFRPDLFRALQTSSNLPSQLCPQFVGLIWQQRRLPTTVFHGDHHAYLYSNDNCLLCARIDSARETGNESEGSGYRCNGAQF